MRTLLQVLRWVIPIVAVVGGFVWWILLVTVWDGSDRFGTIPVPGHKVIHLPAGKVDVSFRDHTIGGGDNDSLNVIPVQLSVRRADHDGADPTITRASGTLKVVNNTGHQKVAELQVPADADYEVTTGNSSGGGFTPALLFGAGESHWNVVWLALGVAVGSLVLLTILLRTMPKPQQRVWTPPVYTPPAPAYTPPAGWTPPSPVTPSPVTPAQAAAPSQDPYDRLERLGQLHREGVITDAEFDDQKRKILGT